MSDTGVGIDAEELPHVFERFYRGNRTLQERGAGSGLGLSIAKSIVDMHHGRISIQSAADTGTQVNVTLPRDMSISSPTAARREHCACHAVADTDARTRATAAAPAPEGSPG